MPRERGISAAERIAASEAALGGINPAGTTSSGSTNFIAAARRAAQAAGPRPYSAKRPRKSEAAKNEKPSGKSFSQRVRSMLAGASVILLVAGGLKLSMNLLEPADRIGRIAGGHRRRKSRAPRTTIATPDHSRSRSAAPGPRIIRSQQAQRRPPTPAEPEPQDAHHRLDRPRRPSAATTELPILARRPTSAWYRRKNSPPPLRTAAASGDPAAAYEIAMRHLEGRGIAQSLEEAARWLERAPKPASRPPNSASAASTKRARA